MFDRINVTEAAETEYVPYVKTVNVTENKAPTDKSIELMSEWTEKLTKNILGGYSTENTELDAKMLITVDPATRHQIFAITFTINGKRQEYVKRIGLHEKMNRPIKSIAEELVGKFVKDIVGELFYNATFKAMTEREVGDGN